MKKERIFELDQMASNAIDECLLYGSATEVSLAFWQGIKTVVDELKIELEQCPAGNDQGSRSSLVTFPSGRMTG